MFSLLSHSTQFCSLWFWISVTSVSKFSSGQVIWSHYLTNVSHKLKVGVDILKNMSMLSEGISQWSVNGQSV